MACSRELVAGTRLILIPSHLYVARITVIMGVEPYPLCIVPRGKHADLDRMDLVQAQDRRVALNPTCRAA